MKRCVILAVAVSLLMISCRKPARSTDNGEARAYAELRRRAEALASEVLPTLPPGKRITKREKGYTLVAGDLFKLGHDVCVAMLVEEEVHDQYTLRSSRGPLFFSREHGQWKLRDCHDAGGCPPPGGAFSLEDLSGDGVPEALPIVSYGATGNVSMDVYRYIASRDSLVQVVESLGRPEWDPERQQVLTWSKGGNVGFDNIISGYDWVGNRQLVQRWVATQGYERWTHALGSAAGLVELEYLEFDGRGNTTYSWQAIGNLPSYRNCIGEFQTWGPEVFADIRIKDRAVDRRRVLRLETLPEKLKELGIEQEWLVLTSRAVLERPDQLTADSVVTTRAGKKIKLTDFARVRIDDNPRLVTHYWRYRLSDARMKAIAGLSEPCQVIAARAGNRDWLAEWKQVLTSRVYGKNYRLDSETSVRLFIRSPGVARREKPELDDDYFVVEDVRFDGKRVRVDCSVTEEATEGGQQVHAVAIVPLGTLEAGDYTAVVTFRRTGKPARELRCVEYKFRVRR